jgi:hypothetical protein
MATQAAPFTMKVLRHVFASWWISIPPEFDEDFVHDDGYWHAWDDHRSVSLSSFVVTQRSGGTAVPAADLLAAMPVPEGDFVDLPPGHKGWARVIPVPDSPKASRAISGMLAVDGRVLLATITSDDIAWATDTWRSIEYAPTPIVMPPQPNRAMRRAARRARHN